MERYQKPVKRADADNMMPLVLSQLSEGKSVKLTVTGYSMYPLVSSRRDAVLLAPAEKVRVGDVPLFQRENGSFILHRLVSKKKGAFAAMGDYETKKEYPVYPEQIAAVAIGFYRKGRFISVKNPLYRIYAFLWRWLLPVRPFLLKTLARLADIKGRHDKEKKR